MGLLEGIQEENTTAVGNGLGDETISSRSDGSAGRDQQLTPKERPEQGP